MLNSNFSYGYEVRENGLPIRSLGMGGASTAVANDLETTWTNPAGIARARKMRTRGFYQLDVPHLTIGLNEKTSGLYTAIAGTGSQDLASVLASSSQLTSQSAYYGFVGIQPGVMFDLAPNRPFASTFFSNTTLLTVVEKDTPEQARVSVIADMGSSFNFTVSDSSNSWIGSLQFRPLQRFGYEEVISTDTLRDKAELKKNLVVGSNKSFGLGVDIGGLYTFPDFWFPTIGISVLNLPTGCVADYLVPYSQTRETVCGTRYLGKIDNPDALSIVDPTDIRIGMSIAPRLSSDLGLRVALDIHHIPLRVGQYYLGTPGLTALQMLHAGVELYTGNPLSLNPFMVRAGVNQGFFTIGMTVDLTFLKLELASYAVDVSSAGPQQEDRRYVLSLSTFL